MRYFPIGAKGAVHVPLAIVEDIEPETKLELLHRRAGGRQRARSVLDLGLVEM